MIFGKTEKKCFDEATSCHICGGELGKIELEIIVI